MTLSIELLERSFSIVKERATDFTETFYTNLFTDYPEVKPLFANAHMEEQGKKLFSSLVLTIDSLRKPEFLWFSCRFGDKRSGYRHKAGQKQVRSSEIDELKKSPCDERQGEYRFLITKQGNDETYYRGTNSKSLPSHFQCR